MKKGLKRTLVGVMSAAVIAGMVPVNASAITKTKRETRGYEGNSIDLTLDIHDDRATASIFSSTAESVETQVQMWYISQGLLYNDAYGQSYGINATSATAIATKSKAYSKNAEGTYIANYYIEGYPKTSKQKMSID